MKRHFYIICAAICILIFWTAISFAGFSLPPEVYRMGAYKEALERAKSINVSAVFVYSDEHTTCPLATSATLDAMQELKEKAIIIYVSRDDWVNIPAVVKKAIVSPEAGKFIPKSIVFNPKTGRVEIIIPYIGDRNQRIEQLQKARGLMKY
jgi:hypothetical protein